MYDHGLAVGGHSPTGSRTQQVRSLLVLIHRHGHPGFTAYYPAPLERDGERRAAQYTCGFLSPTLNLGQRVRGWPSAHVPKASYIEAIHEPHQHLGSLARQALRSQVRGVRLGGDLLHFELPEAHRLLKSQVLNLDLLRFAQLTSAFFFDSGARESTCSRIGTAPPRSLANA